MTPPRVLVADDSGLQRDAIAELLRASGAAVVGTAASGREAVARTAELRPDLVVMDVVMPDMGGLEAVERIMADLPTPILMMTADPRGESGELCFEALRRGALDLWIKPALPVPPASAEALRHKVNRLARAPVLHHPLGRRSSWRRSAETEPTPAIQWRSASVQVVLIAASTGGPAALARLLGALPVDFGWPMLIVQHMPDRFDHSLATWLDRQTQSRVRVAAHGDSFEPGTILVAPAGLDTEVSSQGRVRLRKPVPGPGYHPSADAMFLSAAAELGIAAVGVVLTGMGRDGARGLRALADKGAMTIAQDAASSLVDGMPAAARAAGAARAVLALDAIAPFLCGHAPRRPARRQ